MRALVLFLVLVGALIVAGLCAYGLYDDGHVVKFAPGLIGGLLGAWFCYDRLRVELAE
jgi:hypothetical protein